MEVILPSDVWKIIFDTLDPKAQLALTRVAKRFISFPIEEMPRGTIRNMMDMNILKLPRFIQLKTLVLAGYSSPVVTDLNFLSNLQSLYLIPI